MASTFAGLSLFDSGPHRFIEARSGRIVSGPFFSPTSGAFPYSIDEGKRELAVIQTGRLAAATNAALWALIDAIRVQAELPRKGTLIDHHGRSWPNMTMIAFRPGTRIDRGRLFCLAYTVSYLRFDVGGGIT